MKSNNCKEFKVRVKDSDGTERYKYFQAETASEAMEIAKRQYDEVKGVVEVPASMDLFELGVE